MMSRLSEMDDNSLALYGLSQVRGMGVRGAAERLNTSRGTISLWRRKAKAKQEIRLEEPTRDALLRALEEVPAVEAPDYAAGIRVSLEKVEDLADELRSLLSAAGGSPAGKRARRTQQRAAGARGGGKGRPPAKAQGE